MAENLTLVKEQSSPHPSPGLLGETRIQRRLVKIPSDQRKLLDRQDSWAQSLNRRSKRFLNVPPDVLENLKKWHTRQLQTTQSDESISSSNPQVDVTDQTGQEDNKNKQNVQSEPDADRDDNYDNPATQLSWSASPPEHMKARQRASSEDAQEEFITQLPPISSPQPTEPPVKRLSLPPFPPSSQDQEEPLEIEVPTAINDSVPSVNKPAVPAVPTFATPPSAQIVPCTFDVSEQSSTQTKTKPEQRAYRPFPELHRPTKNGFASKYLNLNVPKTGNADITSTDIESSISTANTSSSVIPSTVPNEALIKARPAWLVNLPISPSHALHISRQGPSTQDSPETEQHSPVYTPQSPQLMSSSSAPPSPHGTSSITTPQHSASHTPFIRYSLTYPTYNGSIHDFVSACVYIQLQQRRIRTSLYDDFIRAWHEGYLPYVRDCDECIPPIKAMNAIEWYNDIDEDPLFTCRVITKQNLQSTLAHYPDELRSAQSLLGLSQKQPLSETASTPDAARLAKGHEPVLTDINVKADIKSGRIIPEVPKAEITDEVAMNDIPPAPLSTLPQPEKRKIVSLHKSFSEIERRPATAKGLTRSFSEATRHKRKASQELSNDFPKRLSVNSLPRSDSGSNASVNLEGLKSTRQSSVVPSSMGEKKKRYADDPKKRSREFAKFLENKKKRKQWEKDSIASSAPTSTSPTSGQKQ
ncbi:hypothetical protein F5Y06DRAFT_272118 [Hypoxylon sp. FL0890]|nr:hypothetical protein F5Y06DRAFT_272118 [Hypoxylon sp. FL0890]